MNTFNSIMVILALILVVLFPIVNAQQTLQECEFQMLELATQKPTYLALMVDATGKSIDDLGKWDQCRDLGTDISHYCTIRFALNISIPSPYVGLCLPSNCSAADIQNITRALLNRTVTAPTGYPTRSPDRQAGIVDLYEHWLKFVEYQDNAGVYQFSCPADTPSITTSVGGMIMAVISCLLVLLVIVGTLVDGHSENWWPDEPVIAPPTTLHGSIQAIDTAEGAPLIHKVPVRRSRGFDFFVAFSLVRNYKSLIGPSPPNLAFLNGMRAISIAWVILGHSLDYMNYAGVQNFAHVITKDIESPTAQVFPAAEFSVDSFFWLSGFLVTYLTVQELKTKKRINWFLYYFHRIWRLSPAYFYALFFYICVSVYMSDGPMWPRYMQMVESTCGKYWWTNVLYINNFIPGNWTSQCFLWGWYLAVDMQLYIVAPIVFILYVKKRWLAWAIVIAAILGTVVLNGALAQIHHFVWNSSNPYEYMTLVYGKPYTRAAPWLLGIACAFLYLEKRQLNSRWIVYTGWALSGTVMMLCVYGPARQFRGGSDELHPPVNSWGPTDNFMYFTFAKLGWSLSLSFLMYSMAMGWGGAVKVFLGAPFWSPLARLTYSTYLFHPIVLFVVYYSHQQYFSYDPYYIAVLFVGIMFMSFSIAAVMFIALERPMTNLEKLFLPHKKN